jgi:hypothetical protein
MKRMARALFEVFLFFGISNACLATGYVSQPFTSVKQTFFADGLHQETTHPVVAELRCKKVSCQIIVSLENGEQVVISSKYLKTLGEIEPSIFTVYSSISGFNINEFAVELGVECMDGLLEECVASFIVKNGNPEQLTLTTRTTRNTSAKDWQYQHCKKYGCKLAY